MAQPRRDAAGIFAPLRRRLFRAIWAATLVSQFGWLIQSVGAAWLMTQLDPNPAMVALVQTATTAPILLVSLLAGALADLWDRRRVILLSVASMLATSALLAALSWAGIMGPWLLLLLTFMLGAAAAMGQPATQAIVRELVPTRELAAAVTANAVGFNLARSVGPALGGLIVAIGGAASAFLINAVSGLPLLGVLLRIRGHARPSDLPRERVGGAIVAGLRYVSLTPAIRATLIRGGIFALLAPSILALLPLLARVDLTGGPALYGLLLAVFGLGALGGAFLIHPLRHRMGPENLVTMLSGLGGAAALAIGLSPTLPVVVAALPFAGAAWLGSFSTFNIAVQMSSAFWVQARVLALYQTVIFGMMSIGSWGWGAIAGQIGLAPSIALSGALMITSVILHLVARLPSGQAPDLRPAPTIPRPEPSLKFDPEEGPVLVLIEYRVRLQDAARFDRAMQAVGDLRRRDGARRWQLFQDTNDAEHWIEAFTVASWLDHLRQTRRLTAADLAVEQAALAYHQGDSPVVRRLIHRTAENAYPAASRA
jgi:MFS family permease